MTATSPPPVNNPAYILSDRAVICISGEDVIGFLQGLVTADVAAELPVWSALLTPQGKLLFDFLIWADTDAIWIDVEAAQADALIRRLSMYRLRRAITIAVDPALGVYWSQDRRLGTPDPRLAALGQRWLSVQSDDATNGSAAFQSHRLSLGVAEGVAELGSDKHLWLECNAAELNGVSFTKGCYVGQENTARMNWRAKVNRRIVVVPIAQADEKRQIVVYPDLGYSIEHRRVEDISADITPGWMQAALATDAEGDGNSDAGAVQL